MWGRARVYRARAAGGRDSIGSNLYRRGLSQRFGAQLRLSNDTYAPTKGVCGVRVCACVPAFLNMCLRMQACVVLGVSCIVFGM